MSASITFPHRLAGHCASGAFRDLFEHRGYRHRNAPLSEPMIFGLGAGLDFVFMPAPAANIPFFFGGRSPQLEESLCTRIGGSVIRRSEPDNDAAWTWVRERLDRGEPVAMVGDCQKLEYLKTRTSMPQHVIVAVGYDDTHALIADNDRDEIQRCSLESLREARSAGGFPLPAMNVTFEIEWPAALPPVESMVLDAIRETSRWLHAPGGLPVAFYGRESFGLAAMEAAEREVHTWSALSPRDASRRAMLLWIAIEKAGTGGAFFRRLWRDFLREAYELVPSPALLDARDHYARLADQWSALGRACSTGKLEGAVERLLAILAAERAGLPLLAAI